MATGNFKLAMRVIFLTALLLSLAPDARAGVPVPGKWQGQIAGQVANKVFRLPVTIEIRSPLAFEENPLNLFLSAGSPKDIGHLYLVSATRFNTSRGPVTLCYLSIRMGDDRLTGKLTESHGAEAAGVNGFSGPNVSAAQASPLMKGVFRNAWGPTEMFRFSRGTMLLLRFRGNQLTGIVRGSGSSFTGSSSSVSYQAKIVAERVR